MRSCREPRHARWRSAAWHPYRSGKYRPKPIRGCVNRSRGVYVRTMIGEWLRQSGVITEEDLKAALIEHKRSGERLGAVLIRMNLATERQIAKALAYQLGFSYVDLTETPPDPAAVVLIPKDVALKRICIAVAIERNLLTVAMSDPLLFTLVQDLEFQTGHRIKQVVATRQEIVDAIHGSYPDKALARVPRQADSVSVQGGQESARGRMMTPLVEPAGGRWEEEVFEQPGQSTGAPTPETAPIIDMVDLVLKSAFKSRASDIHIEPTDGDVV